MDDNESNIVAHRQKVLRALLKGIGKEPLVLKGGAALIFMYDAKRETRDLDFDSSKKIRNLEARIRAVALPDAEVVSIDVLKDTPTTTRLRVHYKSSFGEDSIKIEISHRDFINPEDVTKIDDIPVASIPLLLDQKLLAAFDGERPRTKARDLCDIEYIITTYPEAVTEALAERLVAFTSDLGILSSQYAEAFAEEEIDADVDDVALRVHEQSLALYEIRQRKRGGR